MLQCKGKGVVRVRRDVKQERGNGSFGRDVMLQTVQGGKWLIGRDVMLDNVRGMGSLGRDVMLQTAQGERDSSIET